jgi:hypothetical protein
MVSERLPILAVEKGGLLCSLPGMWGSSQGVKAGIHIAPVTYQQVPATQTNINRIEFSMNVQNQHEHNKKRTPAAGG